MSQRIIVQAGLGLWIVVWVLVGAFLAVTIAACRGEEARNEGQLKVTPINCHDCAELRVTVDKRVYKPGEPITVTATVSVLTNVRLLGSYWCNEIANWEITLVDEQGQAVPRTAIGSGGVGCRLLLEIDHDHPFEQTFQLDTYFELSRPGTYTLIMKIHLSSWASEHIEVIGKPVVFTRLP